MQQLFEKRWDLVSVQESFHDNDSVLLLVQAILSPFHWNKVQTDSHVLQKPAQHEKEHRPNCDIALLESICVETSM